MGEGWSDFYALALLSEPGDDVDGVYAYGAYSAYRFGGLTQNYYFGIRRYPYCTDPGKNPLTFKDIDSVQASGHAGIPRNPVIGTSADEVHNMGEVWCVTLWEARASLIHKYGWTAGNRLILQLVTDGMALSPPDPNYLQARDAILQADLLDSGGANQKELWNAFAKRGMGVLATCPVSFTTVGVQEFQNDLSLSDDQIRSIARWVDSGAPLGDPKDMPAAIRDYCTSTGQEPPPNEGATIRAALESLALRYRMVLVSWRCKVSLHYQYRHTCFRSAVNFVMQS
jgi:hypothetical protein